MTEDAHTIALKRYLADRPGGDINCIGAFNAGWKAALEANADLVPALKTAIGHIEHMAAFFGNKGLGYSFESLGEDLPGIRATIGAA